MSSNNIVIGIAVVGNVLSVVGVVLTNKYIVDEDGALLFPVVVVFPNASLRIAVVPHWCFSSVAVP